MNNRLAAYGAVSSLLTASVIVSAFRHHSNFYAATVWLSKSSGCALIMANFAVFMALCFGKALQKVFFGELRPMEIEHLYERAWYGVTESLLAMTMFRDEFDTLCGVMFGVLMFIKVFHWIANDRVEWMEQSPNINWLFITRMNAVLSLLISIDILLLSLSIADVYVHGVTMMVLFASEYMILFATALTTILKFVINLIDMRTEGTWENKSLYVLYVELFTDFLKLVSYVGFFCIILTSYGLPLNILRDVYITTRSFILKCRDLMRYRAATRHLDELYPSATAEELEALSDKTCIICREDLVHASVLAAQAAAEAEANGTTPGPVRTASGLDETPKKLPCGHIFHRHCLKSWLERQQSCPTCRASVLVRPPPQEQAPAGAQPAPGPANRALGAPPPPQPGQAPQFPAPASGSAGPSATAAPSAAGSSAGPSTSASAASQSAPVSTSSSRQHRTSRRAIDANNPLAQLLQFPPSLSLPILTGGPLGQQPQPAQHGLALPNVWQQAFSFHRTRPAPPRPVPAGTASPSGASPGGETGLPEMRLPFPLVPTAATRPPSPSNSNASPVSPAVSPVATAPGAAPISPSSPASPEDAPEPQSAREAAAAAAQRRFAALATRGRPSLSPSASSDAAAPSSNPATTPAPVPLSPMPAPTSSLSVPAAAARLTPLPPSPQAASAAPSPTSAPQSSAPFPYSALPRLIPLARPVSPLGLATPPGSSASPSTAAHHVPPLLVSRPDLKEQLRTITRLQATLTESLAQLTRSLGTNAPAPSAAATASPSAPQAPPPPSSEDVPPAREEAKRDKGKQPIEGVNAVPVAETGQEGWEDDEPEVVSSDSLGSAA